jgi:hypothetical protein
MLNKLAPLGGRRLCDQFMAEREGFEPPDPRGSTVFKTAAFDRSATSPIHEPIILLNLSEFVTDFPTKIPAAYPREPGHGRGAHSGIIRCPGQYPHQRFYVNRLFGK